MQAIQGYYDNGVVKLDKQAPIEQGKITVIFHEDSHSTRPKMSDEEAMSIFHRFKGSIDREIDLSKEREEYLDEKFGPLA